MNFSALVGRQCAPTCKKSNIICKTYRIVGGSSFNSEQKVWIQVLLRFSLIVWDSISTIVLDAPHRDSMGTEKERPEPGIQE